LRTRSKIQAAARLGGVSRRKLTVEKYLETLARKPKSKKQHAGWLRVTPQALRNFEKAHPQLVCKAA
jgi:hypothetical protein